VVADHSNENLSRASRNVEGVELANPQSLNTYQLLRYKNVVFTRSAIEALDARLNVEATEEEAAPEKAAVKAPEKAGEKAPKAEAKKKK
jgi:hypothetical protein